MLPDLITEIPGPRSLELAQKLRKYESQNVTYTADDWPVFWDRADGTNVWDADGNRYVCLLYTSPSPRDKRQSRMPSSA